MKKMTYVLIAVSALFVGLIAVSWAQMPSAQATTTTTTVRTAPVAAAPTVAPTAPKPPAAAVKPPVAPAVAAPVAPTIKPAVTAVAAPAPATTAPATSTPTVPAATSAAPAAAAKDKPALPKGMEQAVAPAEKPKAGAPEDLRNAMQAGEFLKALSFKLTEAQMIEFARASIKVAKINSKWDVQIAGAESDQMAIEYSNLAVEEIEHALKSIPGLTLDQYNEMTRLTIADKEFSSIYLAYKQLVTEGAFGAVPKANALPAKLGPAETSAAKYGTSVAPITPNSLGTKPVSNSGTALPDAAAPTTPAKP